MWENIVFFHCCGSKLCVLPLLWFETLYSSIVAVRNSVFFHCCSSKLCFLPLRDRKGKVSIVFVLQLHVGMYLVGFLCSIMFGRNICSGLFNNWLKLDSTFCFEMDWYGIIYQYVYAYWLGILVMWTLTSTKIIVVVDYQILMCWNWYFD